MRNIDYNDEKSWNLYKEGLTKGLFQLESNLGRAWSKRLAPSNLEELGALIALIRPGCLKAMVDGKSMTQHYVDRKSGQDVVEYLHDSLTDILRSTKGVLIYQEQSMRIAQDLAGFNLQEADMLRKAIGKKKANLMAQIKNDFLDGCAKVGSVNKKTAAEIFGWIEKSSRYSFNKSHAICYAMDSYWSAWYKANHTKEFFTSYLYYANEKQDPHQEIYELVNEAKLFDLQVKLPKLTSPISKVGLTNNGISFGVKDIKGLTGVTGDKAMKAIQDVTNEIGKEPLKWSWMDILIEFSSQVSSTAFKALASIGFFSTSFTGVTRNQALYEYLIFRELTKKEIEWIKDNYSKKKWSTLKDCFQDLAKTKKEGGGCSNVNRVQIVKNEIGLLQNPPYDLSDDPAWLVEQETKLIGCPVSLTKVDAADTSIANTTCREIMNGKKGDDICVVANVQRVANHKINKKNSKQKGRTMSFLTIEDMTCSLDSVIIFPDAREKYKFILYEGNNLMMCGKVEQDNSFIVDKIHEI